MKHSGLLPILADDPWFGGMTPTHQALFLERARLRRFAQSGALYRIGDPPDGLYGVVQGEIRFVNFPAEGRQLLNYVIGPGGWFGESSLIDGGPRPHDALFTGPLSVLFISAGDFFQLATATPLIYRDIARLSCFHFRLALAHMAGALMLSPERRLARLLLHYRGDPTRGAREHRISQEDLAGAVGVSRQTASKILKRMESEGLLSVGYGFIEVKDEPALRAVAWGE